MSTPIDQLIIPRVVQILAVYGKTISVAVPSDSEYDPETGAVTKQAATSYEIKATPPEPYRSSTIDGSGIKAGDSRIYIAGAGQSFTPREDLRWTIDAATWTSVSVNAIYSGDDIALWEVQLRR